MILPELLVIWVIWVILALILPELLEVNVVRTKPLSIPVL